MLKLKIGGQFSKVILRQLGPLKRHQMQQYLTQQRPLVISRELILNNGGQS